MRNGSEIKEFTKNTLILTLFFTLALHLSWGYIAPYLWLGASASQNDANFTQANTIYMGNIATAVSLNIGTHQKQTANAPVGLSTDVISIAEVLSSPKEGGKKLIASNMIFLSSYVNLLKTDIIGLLDQSPDRTKALSEHTELLKSYYIKTQERWVILDEQIGDLKAILASATASVESAKADMEVKYKGFEYTGVDATIANYVTAKNNESQARVYLAYLERFKKGYAILQTKNKLILDTLINNRDAIIKNVTVVIPSSGDSLIKEMWLLETEAEYKSSNQ